MKIIEALKEIKKIQDKIGRNNKSIELYSSKLSNQKPHFESEEVQRQEIQSLIQSNMDLVTRFLELKRLVDQANLNTIVNINNKEYTILDLLNLKRTAISFILNTYRSLNDSNVRNNMRYIKDDDISQIDRLYDEKEKNEKLAEWQELYDQIDSRLEVVNATTDIPEVFATSEQTSEI